MSEKVDPIDPDSLAQCLTHACGHLRTPGASICTWCPPEPATPRGCLHAFVSDRVYCTLCSVNFTQVLTTAQATIARLEEAEAGGLRWEQRAEQAEAREQALREALTNLTVTHRRAFLAVKNAMDDADVALLAAPAPAGEGDRARDRQALVDTNDRLLAQLTALRALLARLEEERATDMPVLHYALTPEDWAALRAAVGAG